MYAEIIIPLSLPKNYTWSIPEEMKSEVLIGMRVEVMLGANKRYAGIIKKLSDQKPDGFNPKPIVAILDEAPIVFEHQLKLWEWMAEYYMCSEGEVMQAAIPSHLKISSESIFILLDDTSIDIKNLSDSEYIISEALEIKKQLSLIEIQKLLNKKSVYPVINKLIQKGICMVQETMKDKFSSKMETFLLLHPNYQNELALEKLLNEWTRAPKQLDLLLAFLHYQKTEGDVKQKSILDKANSSHAQLKALIDKGVLIAEKRKTDRLAVDLTKGNSQLHTLTEQQKITLQDIQSQLEKQNVCTSYVRVTR